MISIITTAFNNPDYINDAIESMVESCGNIDYEILIGVDNCNKTLDKLVQLSPKLNSRIKIIRFRLFMI